MRVGWVAAAAIGLVVLGHARRAQAYLMDAFDARVVEKGSLELELQPAGYFFVDAGENEHYLVAPSLLAYLGLGSRLDVVLLGRGYARVGGAAVLPGYHTRELALDVRWLVRSGTYDGGGEGLSVALQAGALLPNPGWDPADRLGGHAGVIGSWQWEGAGTLHGNLWGARTPWQSWDVFVDVAFEGPPEWSVRPLVEAWFDHDTSPERGGDLPSILAGVNVDLGEEAMLSAGARYAAWDGYREVEIRASLWWSMRLWEAEPPDDPR